MHEQMPITPDSDQYELVREIGSGSYGVARLMRDRLTHELVAVKYIERGDKVSLFLSCTIFFLIFSFILAVL